MIRRTLALLVALVSSGLGGAALAQDYAWISMSTQCGAISNSRGVCVKTTQDHPNAGGYVYFPNAAGEVSQSAAFNSFYSYQSPYPGDQRGRSELAASVNVGAGAVAVSALSQGFGTTGQIGSSFSGAAAFVDSITLRPGALPFGTPLKVTVHYSLSHASAFFADIGSGTQFTLSGTSQASFAMYVPGSANPHRTAVLVPTDILQAGGTFNDTVAGVMVFDSFVGATVNYQLMLEFATSGQFPGGMDRYGNAHQYSRAGWDSAGVRISATVAGGSLTGGSTAATYGADGSALGFPSDAGFSLVAASGFDYSQPFEVLAIPEPPAALLMSLGGLLVLGWRRRVAPATRPTA